MASFTNLLKDNTPSYSNLQEGDASSVNGVNPWSRLTSPIKINPFIPTTDKEQVSNQLQGPLSSVSPGSRSTESGLPHKESAIGDPLAAPTDPNMDMSKPLIGETTNEQISNQLLRDPGAFEGWFANNANAFANAGQGEQAIGDALRGFSTSPTDNLVRQQYLENKAGRPDLAPDAGVGAGYDIARENALRDIKAGAAAGGLLGSSYMLGQIGQSTEKLNAQQQAAEADYRLRTAAENRAYNEMLGNQATGANNAIINNLNALTSAGNTLDNIYKSRIGAGGELARTAQQEYQDRLTKAGTTATASSNARTDRVSGATRDISNLANAAGNAVATTNANELAADANFMQLINSGNISQALQSINFENLDSAGKNAAINLIVSTMGAL